MVKIVINHMITKNYLIVKSQIHYSTCLVFLLKEQFLFFIWNLINFIFYNPIYYHR